MEPFARSVRHAGVKRVADEVEQETGRSGPGPMAPSDLTTLFRHQREVMVRLARLLTGSAAVAEEVVQEAFLKLYRSASWRRMNDEKAFLARTVWRVALDRRPRVQQESLDEGRAQFAVKGDSPETRAIRKAQADYLRKLIDALPENLRQVLVLSAIEQLSSREIGLLIGIPEGTVRTRLMQAREESFPLRMSRLGSAVGEGDRDLL